MKTPAIRRFAAGWLAAAFVSSAQPTNDLPSLLPPYAELPPTFLEQHGLTLGIASVACALLVGGVLWLIWRPQSVPALPPEIRARRDLEALRLLPQDGVLVSQASQILRRYVITAFSLPPGEWTTREITATMASNQKLGTELPGVIAEFLRRCDAHKFAPEPGAPRPDVVAGALQLVEQGEARRAEISAGQIRADA